MLVEDSESEENRVERDGGGVREGEEGRRRGKEGGAGGGDPSKDLSKESVAAPPEGSEVSSILFPSGIPVQARLGPELRS